MGHLLAFERLDRGNPGIHRVAVVGAATAIELAVLVLGRPGPEVAAPAGEFGLFVQVPVHQYRLLAGGRGVGGAVRGACAGGHFKKQQRRAPIEPDHLQPQTFHLLGLDPAGSLARDGIQKAVRRPLGVEHRRLGRNADVLRQLGHDLLVPGSADLLERLGSI